MKHVYKTLLLLLFMPVSAWAAAVNVPEPEVLPLLGIGLVAAIAVKCYKNK